MKYKNRNTTILGKGILSLSFLLFSFSVLWAQPCDTRFEYYKNGKTLVFVNRSNQLPGFGHYYWNFGDGSGMQANNDFQLSHTYAQAGKFRVCVYDSNCSSNPVFCDSVTATNAKVITARLAYTHFGNGSYYFFDSSVLGSYPIVAYQWDFGDGIYSQEQMAKHNYHSSGRYPISLTLLDSNNNYDIAYDTLDVLVNTPCYAEFNFEYVNQQFQFQNLSMSGDTQTSYTWYFGDGSSGSNNPNPVHQYSQTGNYTVSLVIKGATCSDSIAKQVSQPDTLLCNLHFTSSINYQKATFTAHSSSTEPFLQKYIIDYGDLNSDIMMDSMISHIYLDTGSYRVCISSQINLCGIPIMHCDTIKISSITAICKASFELYDYEYDALLYNSSIAYGSNQASNITIKWGDGTQYSGIDSGAYTHTYAAEGPYNVTLIINNPAGCTDTLSKIISVGPNYTLSGKIRQGGLAAPYAGVNIYTYDSSSGLLYYVNSTHTDENGDYGLKLKKGYYLVQADFAFDPFNTGFYLPTYYRNKLNWDMADVLLVQSDRSGIDIDLIPYAMDSLGKGLISGYVKYGSGVRDQNGPIEPGKPAEKMLIYLLDGSNKVKSYTHTETDGTFSFANIPGGSYKIWGEMAGKVTLPPTVTISNTQNQVSGVKIIIGKNALSTSVPTFSTQARLNEYAVFPNPTNGMLNILWEQTNEKPERIEIYDLAGKQLASYTQMEEALNTRVDLSGLNGSLFLLKIVSPDGGYVFKRVMRE